MQSISIQGGMVGRLVTEGGVEDELPLLSHACACLVDLCQC